MPSWKLVLKKKKTFSRDALTVMAAILNQMNRTFSFLCQARAFSLINGLMRFPLTAEPVPEDHGRFVSPGCGRVLESNAGGVRNSLI